MNGNINWTVVERYGFKKSEFKCGCGGKYCDGYNRRGDKANPHLINFLIKLNI